MSSLQSWTFIPGEILNELKKIDQRNAPRLQPNQHRSDPKNLIKIMFINILVSFIYMLYLKSYVKNTF